MMNKRLGTQVPRREQTSPLQEFNGMTVRQWLIMPFRVVILLPLMLLVKTLSFVAEYAETAFDAIDSKFR
jgi:hypothetical protein